MLSLELFCTRTTNKFYNTKVTVALIDTSIQAISNCRQRKFSKPVNQTNTSAKAGPKPVQQTLTLCMRKVVFKRSYVVIIKAEGESKVPSREFCLFDSADMLQLFHFIPKHSRLHVEQNMMMRVWFQIKTTLKLA